TENIRARLTVQYLAELPQDLLAGRVVDRIDGDELAAVTAVRVLGDARRQSDLGTQKLELYPPRDTIVPHRLEYPLCIIQRGRRVALPALRGQVPDPGRAGIEDEPVILLRTAPPRRQRTLGNGEGLTGGLLGVHHVEERWIRQHECRILLGFRHNA